jgi:hypothetical protein
LHEGALAEFGIETMLAKEGQDRTKVSEMLGFGAGVDEYIIEIDDNPAVKDRI